MPMQRIAPVFLQIIHTPVRILLRILILVSEASGASRAGLGSSVCIDTEFQAFAVNVVRQRLYTRRKLRGIGDNIAGRVAICLPAVVNDDVLIACVDVYKRQGKYLAEAVINRIATPGQDAQCVTVPTELIKRESSRSII